MQGNSEEPAFRRVVDGEIEDRSRDRSVDDVFDLTGPFLEHQKFIGAEKRHRYRLIEGVHGDPKVEIWIQQGRPGLCGQSVFDSAIPREREHTDDQDKQVPAFQLHMPPYP